MSLLSRFLRRNVIADDPNPDLSMLDRLDRERSMADHPAGKRRPAVRPARFGLLCTTDCTTDCGHCKGAGRPAPESLEEALSEDDLLAVARGAGVVREADVIDRLITAPARRDATVTAAMRHYRETGDLDGALAIFATRDAS